MVAAGEYLAEAGSDATTRGVALVVNRFSWNHDGSVIAGLDSGPVGHVLGGTPGEECGERHGERCRNHVLHCV